ncbi:uncharacterized protein LOC103177371 [Callorhinchus milii]|uniref:uncharacterized protein LOC103177371 n=1 Tax=Callorhinchus milii TaxID=7868 RepID=UPI000457635F|nr:uncharacterized protein LOC103177371 [Callorhinchus milii]|eukprot:gi/632935330/ref/XP_007889693.1/ PREDICTED: uncharacterized protein LOC103177371 [Callorhinchus milii]
MRYPLSTDVLGSPFSSGRGYGTVVIRKVVSEGDFMYQVRVFGSKSSVMLKGSEVRVRGSVQSLPVMSNQRSADFSPEFLKRESNENAALESAIATEMREEVSDHERSRKHQATEGWKVEPEDKPKASVSDKRSVVTRWKPLVAQMDEVDIEWNQGELSSLLTIKTRQLQSEMVLSDKFIREKEFDEQHEGISDNLFSQNFFPKEEKQRGK